MVYQGCMLKRCPSSSLRRPDILHHRSKCSAENLGSFCCQPDSNDCNQHCYRNLRGERLGFCISLLHDILLQNVWLLLVSCPSGLLEMLPWREESFWERSSAVGRKLLPPPPPYTKPALEYTQSLPPNKN